MTYGYSLTKTGWHTTAEFDNNLTVAGTVAITGAVTFSGSNTFGDADGDTQTIYGAGKLLFRDAGLYIYSNANGKLTISSDGSSTDDITISGTITGDADWVTTGAIEGATITDGTASLTGGNWTSVGSITATTFTDGTLSVSGGNITAVTAITATTVNATNYEALDSVACFTIASSTGIATFSKAIAMGTNNISGIGTATATTFTDGTLTITGGTISGIAGTTGIGIGTCTTGLSITGATTTGISFTAGAATMLNANAASAAASTRGIFIGEDSNSAQSGIPLLGASWATSQGNALYCDDDGVALVGYTEAFTVRMLTTATVASGDVSTAAIHPDLYLNADYTGAGGLSSIWGNTTIATSKTVDVSGSLGDVGGASFGLDVVGTLATNSHGCGCSVGLGGSGTKDGIMTGFRIRTPTGTVLWDGIMSIPSDGTTLAAMTTSGSNTGTMTNCPHSGNASYWLNVYIGTTKYVIPCFAST